MKLNNVIGCIAGDSKTGSLDNQEGKTKTAASRRQSEPASKSKVNRSGQEVGKGQYIIY